MIVSWVMWAPRFHRVRSVCCVLIALAMVARVVRAEQQLTLEGAIQMALANNERSLKAPFRVEAAVGTLDRARAAFLPTMVAAGTDTVNAKADRYGRHSATVGTLSVNQPIVNLSAYPLYAQARHQLNSETWGALEDRRSLAFDSASAFINALASDRLLSAAQRRLDRATATQQDTQARADAQLASTNDVTRAVIDTTTAESQVAQARGIRERAYLQLSFLVGRPVVESLVAPERTTSAARHGQFRKEDIVRLAESRRPDLKSAEEHTESLRHAAAEPLYRLAPTLGVTGQVKSIVDPLPTDTAFSGSALVTLTWTIYDAGARYADRKTRLAQADSGALDERQLRRSIATDISVAISALRTARANLRISQDAAAAAQRNSEETAILYRQGLARAIELTDADASQYAAEVAVESAQLDMEQAYLNLRQALGIQPTGDELTAGHSSQGGAQ